MLTYALNEKVEDDNMFSLCPKHSYLNEGGQEKCLDCPVNGICEGGYIPMY